MYTEEVVFTADQHKLAATLVQPDAGTPPTVLYLGGLGATSNRHVPRYLLDELAEAGHGPITFDFSGNGDSTGEFLDSTLARRREQALAAAAYLAPGIRPVIIGTSMGAHLGTWLTPRLRPRGLVLFCPAAYRPSAADVPFSGYLANTPGGRREDESLIRPGRYDDSVAYEGIRELDGDLLIVAGRQDEVIAPPVIEGYLTSAVNARSTHVIELDCGHFIHRWLPDQANRRAEVVETILRVLNAEHPSTTNGRN